MGEGTHSPRSEEKVKEIPLKKSRLSVVHGAGGTRDWGHREVTQSSVRVFGKALEFTRPKL